MKRPFAMSLLGMILVVSCRGTSPPPPGAAGEVPFFDGLGQHHRMITTVSGESQKYFNQGLAFLFGFNHDEAIRSFARAAELDPTCAMAWWGIAYANGPHINNPTMPEARSKAAWDALAKAKEKEVKGVDAERALIEALGARYAWPPPEDRKALDEAYAVAMGKVAATFPKDADIAALYAEALMDVHPWDLWNHDGTPKAWTPPIVSLLEETIAREPMHPLALHLYIHAVEASSEPGKADEAADRLRDLVPGLGHMVHMPSHIDVRRGRWEQAIIANTRAMEVDHQYRDRVPKQDFYRIYMAHNHHMRTFAAMMVGRSEMSLTTIREMVAEMPADWLKENALLADGWVAMPLEVLMRFGKWDDILAEPEPADYLPLTRALRHYARGVALAAQGKVEEARTEKAAFAEARTKVAAAATFGNNPAADILGVAEALLDGETLYRAGKKEQGLERLREAVRREDALVYNEPPDWIQPVRHALGAALLQSGKYAEAEQVFRDDLAKLPGNGWAEFGLARALKLQGKEAEATAMEGRFTETWKNADIQITSPCFCQQGV